MKEDRPLLPGRIEGLFQLLDAGDYTEAALCVGVLERRQRRWWHLGHRRLAAGGQLQQRLRSLRRQVVGQNKQAVLVGLAHVVEPLRRDAVAQQLVVLTIREQRAPGLRLPHRGRRRFRFRLRVGRDYDLADRLADLHELRRSGLRVRFELASFGPVVGLVVVIHVAQQQTALGAVDDDADVHIHPHRPEVLVSRLVELVETQAWTGRVHLQVECRGLDCLLFVTVQPG